MFAYFRIVALCALALLASITAAFAGEWKAVRLRGTVLVNIDNSWVALKRGDVVSDDSLIRTEARARVRFQRDAETIDVAANTQIRIIDKTAGGDFTNVVQDYGKVTIQAEVQDVNHFSVTTPYLAAVVKGTRFVVITNSSGSEVEVRRGKVAVLESATDNSVTVAAGQSVFASAGQDVMTVTGWGTLPVVVTPSGEPVVPVAAPSPQTGTAFAAPNNSSGSPGTPEATNAPGGSDTAGPAPTSPSNPTVTSSETPGSAPSTSGSSPSESPGNGNPNANPTNNGNPAAPSDNPGNGNPNANPDNNGNGNPNTGSSYNPGNGNPNANPGNNGNGNPNPGGDNTGNGNPNANPGNNGNGNPNSGRDK